MLKNGYFPFREGRVDVVAGRACEGVDEYYLLSTRLLMAMVVATQRFIDEAA